MNTTPNQTPPMTIAYVVKGFFEKLRSIGGGDEALSEATMQTGEMALVERLLEIADVVEATWVEKVNAEDGFPGVWDYEVSEPLGQWVAEKLAMTGEFPDMDAVKQTLENILSEYDITPPPPPYNPPPAHVEQSFALERAIAFNANIIVEHMQMYPAPRTWFALKGACSVYGYCDDTSVTSAINRLITEGVIRESVDGFVLV